VVDDGVWRVVDDGVGRVVYVGEVDWVDGFVVHRRVWVGGVWAWVLRWVTFGLHNI
jgi:hypothetical protein